MPTVSEAAKELGVSRDQLHYLIKQRVVSPLKVGNRYTLSNEDMSTLRAHLREKTQPIAAFVLAQVRGPRVADAVEQVYSRVREVVWCAGAWGQASLIMFLELPNFDDIGSILYNIQQLDYVNSTNTYLSPPGDYYVREDKDTPEGCDGLAFVLLNVEEGPSLVPFVLEQRLSRIANVKRYGALLGPWDVFAEVRYRYSHEGNDDLYQDDLYRIVMGEIHNITGVLNTTTIVTMPKLRRERGSEIPA